MIFPEQLIDAIARRRAVLVVGSGVSKNSKNDSGERPLSWEEFLRTCCKKITGHEHIISAIERKDYLLACQFIKNTLGENDFFDEVQKNFQGKKFKPADIHEHLYNLDVPITLSPNFDSIYDTFCGHRSNSSYIVKDYRSKDITKYLCGGHYRIIIKNHGSANDPQKIIFSSEDYSKARNECRLFYRIIESLALTNTFLFIGCGVNDPDIKTLFEDLKINYGTIPRHYMTIPDNEISTHEKAVLESVLPIKYISYSHKSSHKELTESLKALVQQVDEKREEISKYRSW